MKRLSTDQGELFGYMQPDGSPSLHPPLCACGTCNAPVWDFNPQPAALLAEEIREPWEVN